MLKFVDLFCGIGGFHEAIRSIEVDSECVLSCDVDKYCRDVYQKNFNVEPATDIKKIIPEHVRDFDVLCAGFPCQSFSNAGKKLTFNDDRGLLFDEIIRLAKIKKPKFMFLENVKHILRVDNGNVFEYIRNRLTDIGYNLQIFKMSPHEYGIPQQRERIYFVCIRDDIFDGSEIVLRCPKSFEYDITKFLDPIVDPKYSISNDIMDVLNAWNEMIHSFQANEKISPTILVKEFYNTYDDETFQLLPKWKQEYIQKHKPLYIKYKPVWDEWYTKHKELLSKKEIYSKLEWQAGPIKENDDIFNYFIQIRQSGIRVKKAEYFPTLVAMSQIPIYGKEKRFITPRECFRLQSFPDSFKIHNEDRHAYKQVGNSVNVANVHNVIYSTLNHYNRI